MGREESRIGILIRLIKQSLLLLTWGQVARGPDEFPQQHGTGGGP